MSTSLSRTIYLPIGGLLALLLSACASSPLSNHEREQLAGRTCVITGASSGIGRGVALALAQAHANVVLAARNTDALDDVARQARAAGAIALVVPTDVSRPDDVKRLAAEALAHFGRIDVWINDAGVGLIGRFDSIPVEHQARVVDVNLKGVIYGSYAALLQFRQQRRGTLINVGSVESEVPLAYQATYGATKHAVLALGRALNEELRLDGLKNVQVATIMPFATDTPIFDHIANFSGHTPRSMLPDPPAKVVNTILHTVLSPHEEVPVGWKGSLSYHAHRLFGDLTEWMAATLYHHEQMELAPPAPVTTGNLYSPAPGLGSVTGTTRSRVTAEDAARDGKATPSPSPDSRPAPP
ncbi:MAG TPA: SDR family NAD(P)-dependent oxidoreductase [Moraxellaceae bacterium]|nr:SDR family NAD(P)-dependent oxidoreductase [Moraxellaceae bacterium]